MSHHSFQIRLNFFDFFFWLVLGFEHSQFHTCYTGALLLDHFALVILEIAFHLSIFLHEP
jgi:hypothetical protein